MHCDSQPACGKSYAFSVKVDVSNGPDAVRKFVLVRHSYEEAYALWYHSRCDVRMGSPLLALSADCVS